MEKIEIFELDDDFDPLADTGFEAEDPQEYAGGIEYQVPVIPDADRSIVPPPVDLPPEERIEKLIHGLPGQKFRLLSAIQVCATPKTLEEAAADLEAAYPQGTSVYPATRIIELLTEAGAIDRIEPEEPADLANSLEEDDAPVYPSAEDPDEDERVTSISIEDLPLDYDEVELSAPATYVATAIGLATVEERWSASAAEAVVAGEPQYRHIYRAILEMCAEPGGKTKPQVADAVDADPVLQKPRRWCQYFLEKLREAGALDWNNAWITTDIGKSLLHSDVLAPEDTAIEE